MSTYQLLVRARRCHRSANAIKEHATSVAFASREVAMHELKTAENLEELARKLERQAFALLPNIGA
jgi:hypothetical protein